MNERAIAFTCTMFFWSGAFIYGLIYKWNLDATVDYFTKSGFHGQVPLSSVLVGLAVAGVIWGSVWGGIAHRNQPIRCPRRR